MLILSINWTNAFIVTVLGLVIVFIVLGLLIALLYGFGVITNKLVKDENIMNQNNRQSMEVTPKIDSAAIAMALHLYYADIHDEESDIITIKSISNKYSPWSVKAY